MLPQYFNCNERLEIFLTCFCNILCYVETVSILLCENVIFAFEISNSSDFTSRHCNICHQQKYSQNFNVNDLISVNFTVLQFKYFVIT